MSFVTLSMPKCNVLPESKYEPWRYDKKGDVVGQLDLSTPIRYAKEKAFQ